jgi:hypothetical protein
MAKYLNTSVGTEPIVWSSGPLDGSPVETLIVIPERSSESDGTTAGQAKFLHNIGPGTEPGTYVQ